MKEDKGCRGGFYKAGWAQFFFAGQFEKLLESQPIILKFPPTGGGKRIQAEKFHARFRAYYYTFVIPLMGILFRTAPVHSLLALYNIFCFGETVALNWAASAFAQ